MEQKKKESRFEMQQISDSVTGDSPFADTENDSQIQARIGFYFQEVASFVEKLIQTHSSNRYLAEQCHNFGAHVLKVSRKLLVLLQIFQPRVHFIRDFLELILHYFNWHCVLWMILWSSVLVKTL